LVEEVDVEETRLKHHHNFFQKINLITSRSSQILYEGKTILAFVESYKEG
jgi:hypothetical protein